MDKNRYVNTRFWDDTYVIRLNPNEKLLFLYLLTNPLTTPGGVYELTARRAAMDTGLSQKEITAAFDQFEHDGKIVQHNGWIGIVNFLRHQNPNPNMRIGIAKALNRAPNELIERLPITVAAARKGFERLSDSNTKQNSNLNGGLFHSASTGHPTKGMQPVRVVMPRTPRGGQEGEGW
ncbi:MAG: hypothetical protein IPK32_09765 [Verrucomicrobiaceae bacterium]|nr:hypothetical protein [Verrucomicrobiaceae bacterium]